MHTTHQAKVAVVLFCFFFFEIIFLPCLLSAGITGCTTSQAFRVVTFEGQVKNPTSCCLKAVEFLI